MTKEEKDKNRKQIGQLQKELVEILLKRAGIKKEDIYETALKSWISKNLDLLTPEEMQRYKGRILL